MSTSTSGKSSPASKKTPSSSASSPGRSQQPPTSSVTTPSSTYFPSLNSIQSLSSTASSGDFASPSYSRTLHRITPPSPIQPLPPINKPVPCSAMQEVAWMHNLRKRCMQNTIRALSGHGKRQFRILQTWEELLDTLLAHTADEQAKQQPRGKTGTQKGRRGGGDLAVSVMNSDTERVVTHVLELFYAVGDDHGEDWLGYVEDSSALGKLQIYITNAPSAYYRRQAALVYLLLNGKRRLEVTDPALDVFAEIYSAFHSRLAPDYPGVPYPCWTENSSSTLYYSRLDALSPLPRSPGPQSPSPGSPGPAGSDTLRSRSISPVRGGGSPNTPRFSPGSPGVSASSGQRLPDPCTEAIEAGFATPFSDADPFAMLNHANKVLRMCWEPGNLQEILKRDVTQNAIGILGNANPLVAFYGEAFFHSIFSHGRFLHQQLDPVYLPAVVSRIKSQTDAIKRAEGNLQCLRVLIDGNTPQHAAFAQQEVDAGIVQLCLNILQKLVREHPEPDHDDWRVLPYVTGILRCVVHHGSNAGRNTYRPVFDSVKGLNTLTALVPVIPINVSGVDSVCLTVCGLLKGERPAPAKTYGPVLQIVKSNTGSQQHHAQYNNAWGGMVGAVEVLEEWQKSGASAKGGRK